MEQIKNYYKEIRELSSKIDDLEENINKEAYKILDELKKIDGWECMIESCQWHYEQYPDEFFNWCDPVVYGNVENPELIFKKGYCGDDDYDVLTINLNIPLEKQVNDKLEDIRKVEEKKQKEKEDKEYKEYLKLKKKYGEH